MAATDPVITLADFIKWEAPGGNVLLCAGGILDYASERYEAEHAVYGSVHTLDAINAGFGDIAEGGQIIFAPNGSAALSDWWRTDLFDTRIRLWQGEVGSDGVTVASATLLADWLVDNVERVQGAEGQDLLTITTMARSEKLFLVNEGNVCSDRHHQTVYPNEKGFENCTDIQGFVAWGTANPSRSGGGYTVPGGSSGKGGRSA